MPFEKQIDVVARAACREREQEDAENGRDRGNSNVRENQAIQADWTEFANEKKTLDYFAEFAAGAGHEINNPLAIVSGRAQTLLQTETSPERRRHLATIIEQTRRAYEMIADVRAFARPPRPELSTFSVANFFRNWVEREKNRPENVGATIRVETENFDANVASDSAMLAAILSALGKNAAEATAADGRIVFFCRLQGATNDAFNDPKIEKNVKFCSLGVENDGAELSEETRRLIFSPFFSGRQAGRGLGFGLPKAWRFAEELGVYLRCEKSKSFDSGVCWRVDVPLEAVASNVDGASSF